MTKRGIFAYLLLILAVLPMFGMTAEAEGLPSSVLLSWDEVRGTTYYDIYSGQDFIVRLPSDARSYTVERLYSDYDYSFSIAARTEANATLDAAFVDVRTTNWDGVYRWVNETDNDNRGRMKSFQMRVETAYDSAVGQYHALYMVQDDGSEIKIFPLYPFGDPRSGEWVSYKDNGAAGTSYRLNAERFNTSVFNPSRWRVDRIVIDYDSTSAYIQTSALGLVLDTVSEYRLYIEDGVKKMSFLTDGGGLAGRVLFKNPNPGEGDAFILTQVE